jgi:hypothetical protein
MIIRVVSQKIVCISSHRRQLRLLRRKHPPVNIHVDLFRSRVSLALSPFLKDRSCTGDHKNVEEL